LKPEPRPPIRVFAPAKINWCLVVERRRPDGYHEIATILQTLDWGDELRCRATRERSCRIECDDPAVPLDDSNLIARAWRAVAAAWPGRVGGLHVRLLKRIPAGGGLGGGSSDAAATLVALRRLYDLPLGARELENLASALGSDCPFFIRGGTALARGRGEILTPLASRLPSPALVVVWPGFASSTARAYAAIKPAHWESGLVVERVADALRQGDRKTLELLKRNVFDRVVIPRDARFRQLKERMEEAGLQAPMLCGSGACLFGLARDMTHARRAAAALARLYPMARAARPRRSGVRLLPGAIPSKSSAGTRGGS